MTVTLIGTGSRPDTVATNTTGFGHGSPSGERRGGGGRQRALARQGGVMNRLQRFSTLMALSMLAGIVLFVLQPATGYDTDLPPPTGRETYIEVIPVRIGGEHAQIQPLAVSGVRWRGARAVYGDRASIEIVQAKTLHDLDDYVRVHVQPRLLDYPDRDAGKRGSRWLLTGTESGVGGGRIHAWQNGIWLFVVEARSQGLFDEVVEQFAFIRRR